MKQNEKTKIVIKNKKKFVIMLLVLVGVIVVLSNIVINSSKRIQIDQTTELNKLNPQKYKEQIYNIYQQDAMMQTFLDDYNNIQEKVTLYILNNSTLEEESFPNIIKEIKKDFSKSNFKKFDLDIPNTWNGKWSIDDEGIVKFKFSISQIEPSWITNSLVSEYIILN